MNLTRQYNQNTPASNSLILAHCYISKGVQKFVIAIILKFVIAIILILNHEFHSFYALALTLTGQIHLTYLTW